MEKKKKKIMQLMRFVIREPSTPLNLPSFSIIYLSPLPTLLFPLPSSFPRPSKANESVIERLFSTSKKYWYWVSKENNHR